MIIFFHVPKCAGTTVESSFIHHFGADRVKAPATIDDYRIIPPEFLKDYAVLAGHISHDYALPYLDDRTTLLTLLRHPSTRIRSLYNYYRSVDSHEDAIQQAKSLSFGQWLNSDSPSIKVMIENAAIRSFTPESYWQVGSAACPELIMMYAVKFLQRFNVVGFVENIEYFLSQVHLWSGVHIANEKLNASPKDSTYDSISNYEMQNWLHHNCELDLFFYNTAEKMYLK